MVVFSTYITRELTTHLNICIASIAVPPLPVEINVSIRNHYWTCMRATSTYHSPSTYILQSYAINPSLLVQNQRYPSLAALRATTCSSWPRAAPLLERTIRQTLQLSPDHGHLGLDSLILQIAPQPFLDLLPHLLRHALLQIARRQQRQHEHCDLRLPELVRVFDFSI